MSHFPPLFLRAYVPLQTLLSIFRVSQQSCSMSGPTMWYSTGHTAVATQQATQHRPRSTGHVAQDTQHRPCSTGHAARATQHRTCSTGHAAQATQHRYTWCTYVIITNGASEAHAPPHYLYETTFIHQTQQHGLETWLLVL